MDITSKLDVTWDMVDRNWDEVLQYLRRVLPCDDLVMYDNDGNLIESGRPLIESIICDKRAKSKRFFYYTAAAGLYTVPEADVKITQTEHGRIIEVGGYSGVPLGIGSTGDVRRANW
jgi:hypothetical protein